MRDHPPAKLHRVSRRQCLCQVVLAGLALPLAIRSGSAGAASAVETIVQPDRPTPHAFMQRAFDMKHQAEAMGDQPYGAVVVRDGRIVGQSPSWVVVRGDLGAHAEREAIGDALSRVGGQLAGSILYSTSRPCPICERAAAEAAISRMIHGEALTDAGPPRGGSN